MSTKGGIVSEIPFNYLKRFVADSGVIRFGGARVSREDFIEGISQNLTLDECEFLKEGFDDGLSPKRAAEIYNEKYRPNEAVVRDYFLDFLNKEIQENEAIFFEHPVGGNRADINRFNGKSYTYELKSPRDSSKRIGEQIESYRRAFEYVYLVLPEGFLNIDEVDDSIGIVTYTHPSFEFNITKEAQKQDRLDPSLQLSQLRLMELKEISCATLDEGDSLDDKRNSLINDVLARYDNSEINEKFKAIIKKRHTS